MGEGQGVGWELSCKAKGHRLIPDQGTCLGCGFGLGWGAYERQLMYISLSSIFLSLSFSLPPHLSK